jgi:hypothetical protein
MRPFRRGRTLRNDMPINGMLESGSCYQAQDCAFPSASPAIAWSPATSSLASFKTASRSCQPTSNT